MKKRFVSFLLALMLLLACVPAAAVVSTAENITPTIYVVENVYGKPGETVDVKIGFKNTSGKNIQQFAAVLSAGDAVVETTVALEMNPMPDGGGAGYSNINGTFGFACGQGSFTTSTYAVVKVTIPENAKDGDVYDLNLSVSNDFEEIMRWEGGESLNGNVLFEGAKLYVSRYEPVTVAVQDTFASVGDSVIRVPVVMSASTGKLASCSQISFSVSGSAANKVEIDMYASKEYGIKGVNESYITILPEARTFSLGFAGGFENAVAPGDNFQIFELVFNVTDPLDEDDTLVITPVGNNPLRAYGESATETVVLYVEEYVSGTVTTVLPYEWVVLDEEAATAELQLYTGSASVVNVPSTVRGDGITGTEGKEYTVVSLYGELAGRNCFGVFYGNTNVTSISIPESVLTVNEFAISDCPNLESLIVMSPTLTVEEPTGEAFLYYYDVASRTYVLPENLVIRSYESATIRTWASDNEAAFFNLISLVGEQKGEEGLRFIGGVVGLEYQSIDFNIRVMEADKVFSNASSKVYKTLKGIVNGVRTPVVTTSAEVAEQTGAYLVNEYAYLYGFAISGVPAEGSYTFEVTPTAVTAGGVTVYGKTVTVSYVNGNIVNN